MKKSWTLYVDGAARGNPGPAGAGAVLLNPTGDLLGEFCEYLGETTNNVAEYRALLLGLKQALAANVTSIKILADSQLMVRQILGEYRVKNQALRPLFQEAMGLLKKFEGYTMTHIPREENREADRMANEAIDLV